ncbi:MAG: hypothetical protein O2815_01215 [Actinomycetota bacterium]|nr:hypothetical protein [Actinomycetota bacterium]
MINSRTDRIRPTRWMGFIAGVTALLFVAAAAPAAHAGTGDASVLKGTWIGTYSGYDANRYESGQEKLVITKVKGSNAQGTWQYRPSAKQKWSKPKPMTLAIFDQEETANGGLTDYIAGGDELGTYIGKYDSSDDSLVFAYVSVSQDVLTLTFDLKRKK